MALSLGVLLVFFFATLLCLISVVSAATTDTLSAAQSIRDSDGNALISSGGRFKLGFFSPRRNPKNRYLGIWYNKIPTHSVVWVANRETPLPAYSGVLKLMAHGALTLLNGSRSSSIAVWSSPAPIPSKQSAATAHGRSRSRNSGGRAVLQLLESGNLVVREEKNTRGYWWQSFDYPGDTFLPGMKLGKNLATGLDLRLTSWKSSDDPSSGNYTFGFDTRGFPQMVIREGGSVERFRSGPWNGVRFSGVPKLKEGKNLYNDQFVFTHEEVSFSYHLRDASLGMTNRAVLSPSGAMQFFTWVDRRPYWVVYYSAQTDDCDHYALCGDNGICDVSSAPVCRCLKGFEPKYPEDWGRADWSNGCVRRKSLSCPAEAAGDGFLVFSGVKLPDTKGSWFDEGMNLEECRARCLGNCSCTAYSSLDISTEPGGGCLLWFGELVDIKVFGENGQDLYVRIASSEKDRLVSHQMKRVNIVSGSISGLLLLSLALGFYLWRRKKLYGLGNVRYVIFENPREAMEIPFFNYTTLSNATNHFSIDNKLGEGGFGPVYKGRLGGEQDIAVKILSEESSQGLNEFKTEVLFISKLQHRNLVKLMGCCIQKTMMLVYEYVPQKSLDLFIFDRERSILLDWPKRMHIINGISRGILYLHEDSRLRIVHRDLKASNILLDDEMNPKISDFGLARSFWGNRREANTKRVVGTHGYMSPEYAIDGLYSTKSDVFSFGVLVLEIVSGKRNRGFSHPDHDFNLLGHAWKLYIEGRALEVIDASVDPSCNSFEALLLIHLALLCVQRHPEDRPSMTRVVQILGGESALFPPKQPGLLSERNPFRSYSSLSKHEPCSNRESITIVGPR